LTESDSYLWVDTGGILILFTVKNVSKNILETSINIADDGSNDGGWRWFIGYESTDDKFFTATTKQIELLNAYKNEGK